MFKIKYIAGLLMLGFTMSCTNLDEELYSQIAAKDFGKTQEEVAAALANAYTGWTGGFMEPWTASEVSSDEMVVPTRGADWFDNGMWQRLHTHAYLSGDDSPKNTWPPLFGGINTANRLLKQFEPLAEPGNEAEKAVAELKALRAMHYFFLMDLYGNVPLQTSFDQTDIDNGSGADYSQRVKVYNFIVGELEGALPLLSKAKDQTTYGKMNYWAAQALLAKLYLNEGVYNNPPSAGSYIKASAAALTKAASALDEIIDDGGFALEADYFSNFNAHNEASTENIFVIVYDQVFAGGLNINMRTFHYGTQDTYNFTAQPWNGYCTLEEFYNSFDKNDKRFGDISPVDWPNRPGMTIDQNNRTGRSMFIVGPQFKSDGTAVTDGSQYDEIDGAPLVYTPEITELGPKAQRQAGARVGKFEFEVGSTPEMNNDYPIFRYGDILLMRAEVYWATGNTALALATVNNLRAVRGVPDLLTLDNGTSRLGDHLLGERAREVAFEYWRRNDLIRFGRYNDEWWGKETNPAGSPASTPVFDPHVNVFPIPEAQIQASTSIKQNPGY
ncbi:MAG: RagB/SusD family nutrient uptake outer membrane protein [Cyclobacteriaceae bacterium]|nr:RagB/SusD family nutrient uptake outer membrane protein [Cyclobacteriaceae bacterium]